MHTAQVTPTLKDAEAATTPADPQDDRVAAVAYLIDDSTETVLRGGLGEQLANTQIRRGGIRAACRTLKSEPSPRVLIVDISGEEDDPVKALDALAAVCAPDIKVLVLGERSDIEFYRLITRRLGVDEYLRKPLTRDGVASLIVPYVAGAEPEQERNRAGRIITVCGVRGGCGATTIACNLALQIAEQTRSHVALLDLHLRGGHAAMTLGVQPVAGLRTALEKPDHVDLLLLDRVAVNVADRLRMIAADESFDADPDPSPAGVNKVLSLLRQRYNIIIVDMPIPPSAAEREALLLARQAMVVLTPDVASLRDANQTRQLISGLIGPGRAMLVVNRATMPGALKPGLIEQGLGAKPEVLIPDMPKLLTAAANLGRPAIRDSVALRRALAPLTQEISGVEQNADRARLFSWFKRS